MRRTGSEEIGFKQSPRPAGITSGVPRVLPLADFFGEAPELRPWIKEHDDAGRTLPGFIFAFVFYWLDLPTDCAIEPIQLHRPLGFSILFSCADFSSASGFSKPAAWRTILALAAAAISSASRLFFVPVDRQYTLSLYWNK